MDKIEKYKRVVKDIVEEVYTMSPSDDEVETIKIIDDERGHYLLYSDGWRNARRLYTCFLHLEVRQDAKVWLRHDGTDLVIAEWLLDKGIPKEDIVLAFHAPSRRHYTGFATT